MHLIETKYKRNVMQKNKYTKIKTWHSLLLIVCIFMHLIQTNKLNVMQINE